MTNVFSPACGASSVATRHCCHLSKRSTLFLCLVPNILGSGGVALFLFLVFLLGFFSIEFCTAPVEFCTAPVKLCTAPLGFCIWLIAPPELCRCSITIFPSAANAGVAVSISVVEAAGVIDCRCCPLADLLGVLSTSLFTSLFCVVEAGDFSVDAVPILFSWFQAEVALDWFILFGVGLVNSSLSLVFVKIGGVVQAIGLGVACATGVLSVALKVWYSCDEKFTCVE